MKGIPRKYSEYDGYWREPTVECSGCQMMRPFSYYTKNVRGRFGLNCYCRRCQSEVWKKHRVKFGQDRRDRSKKKYYGDDNGETTRRLARERYHANPEASKAKAKRRRKVRRAYHTKYMQAYFRQPEKRFVLLARTLRDSYKILVTADALSHVWLKHPAYLKAFEVWKASGYNTRLSPTFLCTDVENFQVSKLILMTRGEKLSIISKRRVMVGNNHTLFKKKEKQCCASVG